MIAFITLFSEIDSKDRVIEWQKAFLNHHLDLNQFDVFLYANQESQIKDLLQENDIDAFVVLLAGGGVEQLAEVLICESAKPVLLWVHSEKNSLAAGMEIMGLYRHAYPLKMIYGNASDKKVQNDLHQYLKIAHLLASLKGLYVALIGDPSEWLILSQKTENEAFGINFISLDTALVHEEYLKLNNDKTFDDFTAQNKHIEMNNISQDDLKNALKVHQALLNIVNQYQIQALTLRCFDLLKHKYTACLALSLLNDQGITSACEGDKHALVGMLIAQRMTHQAVWMANPSSLDFDKNQMIFAHCSVPLSMLDHQKELCFKTHMESDLSVAIEAHLKNEEVTIFRLGGAFDQMIAFKGKIIGENEKNPELCRTQSRIEINGDLHQWFAHSLGNHHLIVYGDILEDLDLFCHFTGIEMLKL